MARSRVTVNRGIEKKLARSPGVRAALDATAEEVLDAAKGYASRHTDSGEYAASLHIERRRIDRHVVADADHSLAVEYGHHSEFSGEWVDGQYILTRAANDAAG